MEQQITQLQQTYAAMTGSRGMQLLLPLSAATRNYLPPDWATLEATLMAQAAPTLLSRRPCTPNSPRTPYSPRRILPAFRGRYRRYFKANARPWPAVRRLAGWPTPNRVTGLRRCKR